MNNNQEELIMGGFDKYWLMQKLEKLGWVEVEVIDPKDDFYQNKYMMRPPDALWKNKPESFHVYDAVDLQGILGKPILDDEQ